MALVPTFKTSWPGYGASSLPVASASFTPSNNSLLVVAISSINSSSNDLNFSVSGGGLTWTRRVRSTNASNVCTVCELWTAPVATGASMTVSVNTSAGVVLNDGGGLIVQCSVTEFTGYDTTTTIGKTGLENNAQSVTWNSSISQAWTGGGSTASDSYVFEALAADGRDFATSAPNGTDILEGSGYTAAFRSSIGGGAFFRSTHAYKSGALTTYDFQTWQDNWGHATAAIEILAASGGAAAYVPYNPWPQAGPCLAQ